LAEGRWGVTAYYNEHDKFAAAWLRNLIDAGHIAPGEVDERSITDVSPEDVKGFTQCHFFAGLGGWSLALRLSGWADDAAVWTGSCPCQPFSMAGKRKGTNDARHLWPDFRRLIADCEPAIVFGEQVASGDGRKWLAGVRSDLETLGYGVGAADLCAAGVGAPHIRQRIYFAGQLVNADCARLGIGRSGFRETRRPLSSARSETIDGLGNTGGAGFQERIGDGRIQRRANGASPRQAVELAGNAGFGMGDTDSEREGSLARISAKHITERGGGFIDCKDGKQRRIESGSFPLAHGIPASLGRVLAGVRGMVRRAKSNRVGRLRGYGNAIVPQVAAKFIAAFGGDA